MPSPLDRAKRHIERRGRFLIGQTEEELQLNDGAQLRVFTLENDQQLVYRERGFHLRSVGNGRPVGGFDGNDIRLGAGPCVVDQITTHRARRDGDEMTPVLPFEGARAGDPEVGFVDERRWCERVAGTFAAHVTAREPAQIGEDQLDHTGFGATTALPPLLEKTRDFAVLGIVHAYRWSLIDNAGVESSEHRDRKIVERDETPRAGRVYSWRSPLPFSSSPPILAARVNA